MKKLNPTSVSYLSLAAGLIAAGALSAGFFVGSSEAGWEARPHSF